MKDYKWVKGLGWIALCALGGMILSWGIQIFLNIVEASSIKQVFHKFIPNLFWIALVCGLIGILGYFYFNVLLKKDHYSNDEGCLFEKCENKINSKRQLWVYISI